MRTIGQENPLAATQFGLLNAAVSLPLAYMQADAAIGGGACVLLGLMLWVWRRRIPAI